MATSTAGKITPPQIRTAVWNALLDADMNHVYWRCLSRRYYNREKATQVFLALSSSSAVAGWVLVIDVDILWKTLSALSATIAIILPILNWQRQIEVMSTLAGKWFHLRIDYESLWIDVESRSSDNALRERFEELRKREVEIDNSASNLPDDRKLADKAAADVLKRRGLNGG